MGHAPRLRRFQADAMLEQVHYFREYPGTVRGISTGFQPLDYVTGGLKQSELIILCARPGIGKTRLALSITDNAVAQGYAVAFFSQEMSEEQLLWALTSKRCGIPQSAIQHGYFLLPDDSKVPLTEDDYRVFEETALDVCTWDIGLYVGGITTDAMREAIKASKREIGLVVTDHIGLHTDLSGQAQYQRMTYISRSLKDVKLEFGIPIIAVAQLNRAVEQRENKSPQMSDLRDSGSLEQDADQIWAMWREDYYANDDEERQRRFVKVKIDVLKNRNGMTGPVYMMFDKWTGRFFERMEEVEPERLIDSLPPSVPVPMMPDIAEMLGEVA